MRPTPETLYVTAILGALGFGAGCAEGPGETTYEVVSDSPACAVVYEVTEWGSGFTGSIALTNKGPETSAWELAWDFTAGQQVTTAWDASASQSRTTVTLRSLSFNGTVPTNGTVRFAFNGSMSGENPMPDEFRLGGRSCGATRMRGAADAGIGRDAGAREDSGPAPCSYPAWQAGVSYDVGAIVRYADGALYIAEHENPGYDPLISTWFWEPYSCGGS